MVKSTVQDIRVCMDRKHNIRNISVVGQVHHGKSILLDSLLDAVAQDVRMTNTHPESTQCSTIKSTGISFCYEMSETFLENFQGKRDGNSFLINLIDSPGHIELSSEVTAALRVSDGALVVVDCIEGVGLHTKLVLQQALDEQVKPVLIINKMDRLFREFELTGEEAYRIILRIVDAVNGIISKYKDGQFDSYQVFPEKGTVAFSSGLHAWAFSLSYFAKFWAPRMKIDEDEMLEKMWGDNFFDNTTEKWTAKHTGSPTCKRGFVFCCYQPILHIMLACKGDKKKLWSVLKKLSVVLKDDKKELTDEEELKKCVMQTWLPVSNTLFEMMVFHLPSAAMAQAYRVDILYKGLPDDKYATAIRNCDPRGPLMLYVSKMIPANRRGRFFAFGRVFSGTVATGKKVKIMDSNYVPGGEADLCIETVEQTSIWMCNKEEEVESVPCGSTVVLVGIDKFIDKNCTLTDEGEVNAYALKKMKFLVPQIMRVSVQCKKTVDQSKLKKCLEWLSKSDPLVLISKLSKQESSIACAGRVHLEICLKDFTDFMGDTLFMTSMPILSYRETVLSTSCLMKTKSKKNHNRLEMVAERLDDGLAGAIDDEDVRPNDELNARAEVLFEKFGWDMELASRIMCFGPKTTGPNLFMDVCRDVMLPNDFNGTAINVFQELSEKGVLAEENMRGICFKLSNAEVHPVARLRYGHINDPMRRLIQLAHLNAKPRLMEPVYLIEIQVNVTALVTLYRLMSSKKAELIKVINEPGTLPYTVRGYLRGDELMDLAVSCMKRYLTMRSCGARSTIGMSWMKTLSCRVRGQGGPSLTSGIGSI